MRDASDAEVREALGSGFPKHPLHKIACIGALVASRQPEGWRVDALGAPHTGERSEAQLIRDFIEKIGQLRPHSFGRASALLLIFICSRGGRAAPGAAAGIG